MPKNQIEILENGNLLITLPIVFKICGQRKKMIMPDSEDAGSVMHPVCQGRHYVEAVKK